MNRPPCAFCGRRSVDEHHVCGHCVDAELTFPHCHDHHELLHDDWWTAGVGAKRASGSQQDLDLPATKLHRLYLALRRAALWLGRLAANGLFEPLAGQFAAALGRWAADLLAVMTVLDSALPQWRTVPGIAL